MIVVFEPLSFHDAPVRLLWCDKGGAYAIRGKRREESLTECQQRPGRDAPSEGGVAWQNQPRPWNICSSRLHIGAVFVCSSFCLLRHF